VSKSLTDDQKRRILAEPPHLSARDVSRRLGDVGSTAVAKARREAASAPPDDRPTEPTIPHAESTPTDDEIEAASLETREEWLATAGRAARAAEARGDFTALARFGTLAASLYESIRKAQPPRDERDGVLIKPGELQALAKLAEDRFLQVIHQQHANQKDWPVCPACKQAVEPAVAS
jgi:hypothetical protein